jgi:hypothetical protein
MTVSNAPSNVNGVVTGYRQIVQVKEARIAVFPTPGACLSSGYGPRNDRLHKGLDFHAETGVTVMAGGDGEIVEIKYREDYGNMILIDHGGVVRARPLARRYSEGGRCAWPDGKLGELSDPYSPALRTSDRGLSHAERLVRAEAS